MPVSLGGLDVVCLSSIDWDFLWQGHHEIMTHLAREGSRVLFVENTGVRAPRLRDAPRLARRMRNWVRSKSGGLREERPNLFVLSPLLLPFPYSRMAGRINRALLGRSVRTWTRDRGRPILWTFLPTPLAHDVMRDLRPRLTVYYCIDDLASSSHEARALRRSEEAIFTEADLVFVTSEKLRQRAARFTERVHVFPFGVDFEAFDRVRRAAVEVPAEFRALPRPWVGYVGGVHRWVDLELLSGLADRLPAASFILVGPPQTDLSLLAGRRNVHLLGVRPHEALPAYIKAFDVGIIPYRLCEYTDHVYPTKLNEYLAMGIPVVATDLPEIRRVNVEHRGLVAIAQGSESAAAAIRNALDRASAVEVERRIRVARGNSWASRISRMCQVIDEASAGSPGSAETSSAGGRAVVAQAARG